MAQAQISGRPVLAPEPVMERVAAELADAAEEVAAGEARLAPSTGLFGKPVLAADHGHFSILAPTGRPWSAPTGS